MKRHTRVALAAAAFALVLPVSGCASLLSPHQTAEYHYNAGDGASATLGDVDIRGLMVIMDKSGTGPAELFFSIVNNSDTAETVTVAVSGTTTTETVDAGAVFRQDPKSPSSSTTKPLIIDSLDAKPGDLVDVDVTVGSESKAVQTQVLSNAIPDYEEYVPTEAPTSTDDTTPTDGTASANG